MRGGLTSCLNNVPDAEASVSLRVNKKSIIQIFSGCVDTVLSGTPRFSFVNDTSNETVNLNKTFMVPRNHYLAYRVVPRSNASDENESDRREQHLATGELPFHNQITRWNLRYTGAAGTQDLDIRQYVLSTALRPKTVPVSNKADGLAVVGEYHEALTQEPVGADNLSYIPIGLQGITSRDINNLITGTTRPTNVVALNTLAAGGNDDAAAIMDALFPETSALHGMSYFVTVADGSGASVAGTIAVDTVPHVFSLSDGTTTGNAPNSLSPELDVSNVSALSTGVLEVAAGALVPDPNFVIWSGTAAAQASASLTVLNGTTLHQKVYLNADGQAYGGEADLFVRVVA